MHAIEVESVYSPDLADSDKLNGIEYVGVVKFKKLSCREAGDPGILMDGLGEVTVERQRGKWTQWAGIQPDDIHVTKQRGQWHVVADTWLLRGTMPTPADFANAGVR